MTRQPRPRCRPAGRARQRAFCVFAHRRQPEHARHDVGMQDAAAGWEPSQPGDRPRCWPGEFVHASIAAARPPCSVSVGRLPGWVGCFGRSASACQQHSVPDFAVSPPHRPRPPVRRTCPFLSLSLSMCSALGWPGWLAGWLAGWLPGRCPRSAAGQGGPTIHAQRGRAVARAARRAREAGNRSPSNRMRARRTRHAPRAHTHRPDQNWKLHLP